MMKGKHTYVVIQDWMLELDIDLTEVVVLAVIYGFSQDGETTFRGSWKFLEYHAKCSRKKVYTALKHLVELGYIKKKDKVVGGVKFCEYFVETGGFSGKPVVADVEEGGFPGKHNNEDTVVSSNSNNKDVNARVRESQKFDFIEALVSLGVERSTAADWTATRKKAGASNNQSEYDLIAAQIKRACDRYGYTAQECVAYAAGRTWRGFNADWEDVKKIKNENNRGNNADGDKWIF